MKILLLGKGGRLGGELRRSLASLGQVTALGRADPGGDYLRPDALRDRLRALAPDVIVNAAAYTDVDRAEREPLLAHQINAQAPALLAAEARRLGAWLVHYSTDYVFSGAGTQPYVETDAVHPLSVYGRTKAHADEALAASGCRCLILRTSWLYADRGANFARAVLARAQTSDTLSVVTDQIGAPTGADLVADVTRQALCAALQQPGLAGLYHLAAAGAVSRDDYARFVLSAARARGVMLRVPPEAIVAVSADTRPGAAMRPGNSRLDTKKLRDAFGVVLPPWQEGILRLLASGALSQTGR